MLVFDIIVLLMRSRICLLILPISGLVGLIRRHDGLLRKLGLLSLKVMNASLLAVDSTLSSISNLAAMLLSSAWIVCIVESWDFLYDVEMLRSNRS